YTLGGRPFAFAAPPRALPPQGITIAALGDMGTTAQSRAALQAIQGLAPDLILHAGDISYAEGDPVAWKSWFDLVEPVAATRPWVVALGNHETYTAAVASAGAASPEIALFRQRFGLPGNELYYSFDWAGVHVVALDTFSGDAASVEAPIAADEVAWLEGDLAAHRDAPWTIAVLHEPAYSSNAFHGSSARVQQALVPVLEEGGVDLVIQAHDHAYERSLPLSGGAPAEDGVVYVTTGGGGESLYTQWQEPSPTWSAVHAAVYHVLEIHVTTDVLEGRVVPTAGDAFADAFRIVHATSTPEPGPPRASPAPDAAVPLAVAALALLVLRRRRA
ncbi:MAG TPA: purple acid phosphatase, partial [Candidatus Thermoplasmatota archaeon]|nr:purple acid phosphatase [Candidatus Thermoplasmatota archaeon]